MNKLLKFIVLIFIVGYSAQSNGQYVSLKGGVNMANQIAKDNSTTYSSDYSNRIGYHVGLVAGIGAGPIAAEGGVLVSSKGFNSSYTVNQGGTATTFTGYSNLTYLDIPINLKLRAGLGGARVFVTAGPVFSFGLTGTNYEEQTAAGMDPVSEETDVIWGDSDDSHYKQMDIGVGLGGGLQLGKISLSATYNWGLINLAPNPSNGEEIKSRTLQFTLGFKLFG